ncbi:hypothetical protein A3J19_03520 [Candidatus Daviesbacteria bacterium RIFCSPLOWO2_02_FULL_41_8]|uniref:Uncharacterized protein n=2 Tax=Candidatus Daviesiibacteriota TaxID=1752718 RepID=A0A1F5NHJ1_9BACT|nr:MAG: hypothetical protein A3D83_04125 [Candidatus Daviesbacteria bacterium RIFCSPHIGHO2_02_FULL_41_10]OGE76972.1 MAG: hypothetical protein A3J19_03520 [Candidatus Daviesbacteria bacterium RIFCSPLOWO2_02_FULL_41_8]
MCLFFRGFCALSFEVLTKEEKSKSAVILCDPAPSGAGTNWCKSGSDRTVGMERTKLKISTFLRTFKFEEFITF